MQRSQHRPAILAAALGLSACAAPGDAFAPRAPISSDLAAAPLAHAVQVAGGGTTTFGADLDGDGDIDASHFGFAAVIAADGSAQGHFTCLMAGNADFLGLHLMAVHRRAQLQWHSHREGAERVRPRCAIDLPRHPVCRYGHARWPGGRHVAAHGLRGVRWCTWGCSDRKWELRSSQGDTDDGADQDSLTWRHAEYHTQDRLARGRSRPRRH